jgi:transposase-like protein
MQHDGAIEHWQSRLKQGKKALRVFEAFYDEVLMSDGELHGLSPKEVVVWQHEAKDKYRILELAEEWLNRQKLRYSSKMQYLTSIRSFFLHNREELPHDKSFTFDADTPPVVGKLTIEAFKRILHNSNRMYRAVFLMMAQGLMGEGELLYVNTHYWREILRHIQRDDGVFKLVLPGRKRQRNQQPFTVLLSTESDFGDHFRLYLQSLSHKPKGCLFTNRRRNLLARHNIQYYFHWRAVEAGVIEQHTPKCPKCHGETVRRNPVRGDMQKVAYICQQCGHRAWAEQLGTKKSLTRTRYGVNPHEIRDLMRSRWHVSEADPLVAEHMMGHTIDRNHYNKFMQYEPWYPIQEYRKALSHLNVLSEEPEKVSRTEIEEKLASYEAEMAQIPVLRRELELLRRDIEASRE